MNDSQPNKLSTLSPDEQRRIDRVCDEFELALRKGDVPRIEDFVSRLPENLCPFALSELIGIELELLKTSDAQAAAAEYRNRFSDHEDAVEFALRRAFREIEDPNNDNRVPGRIGRFEIREVLGIGTYGRVYLAHDGDMDRLVALKVPTRRLFQKGRSTEAFLQEARSAAKVKHPGLVAVFDVQTEGDQPFIVQEYIQGNNLGDWTTCQSPSVEAIVRLVIEVAEGLVEIHKKGLVHRDLKPANILVDEDGHAHVADFGLAVHTSEQQERQGELAGSPAYMSPEQVRREAHRLDGRSDIWSLGAITYEMLTGQRPFAGEALSDEIQYRDPRPPRMLSPSVPAELARICLTCLAKRATDRYQSATDLIDDLQHWLEGESTLRADNAAAETSQVSRTETPIKIVPKGLRSFDADDADVFLELLPGPRDRDGLPKGIRFWKTQIEQRDPDETFTVGLMYGPSGCGKTSLVNAGLIPRLNDEIMPIHVEATATDTEVRLIRALRKHCPELPTDNSLPEMIARLRTGSRSSPAGCKVLLVLDQFEQWLHAHEFRDDSQLIPALRQCDGSRVQCVVLLRDDFWMSATCFMQALEVPLLEGHNSAAVDLFDTDHARKVLTAFGRAFGKLSEQPAESDEERRFLQQAVDGLADEGKVVCIRLSLFAEMMKGRPWSEECLREVGGTEGVGVNFLEDTFSAKTAPPSHRLHEKAVRAVLKALLPEQGTDIKGQMKSYTDLMRVSGYAHRRADFESLLGILDSEVRLITPTEPHESIIDDDSPTASEAKYYQLTHDFLVPSLRIWLTRKQKETRRGRAELRLTERSAAWRVKWENRHLPAWWEYLNILLLTDRSNWTQPQQKMMRRAGTVHGTRWGIALIVVLFSAITFQILYESVLEYQTVEKIATLQNSSGSRARKLIEELTSFPSRMVKENLQGVFPNSEDYQQLLLSFALAEYDDLRLEFMLSQLEKDLVSREDVENLALALKASRGKALSAIRSSALDAETANDWQHKTRLAVLAMYLDDTSLAAEMLQAEPDDWKRTKSSASWDPVQRTEFIATFRQFQGDIENLASLVHKTDNPDLRSGISLAIGNITRPNGQAKAAWKQVWQDWYKMPDSGSHSAAAWAMRRWGLEAPSVTPTIQPTGQRDWWHSPLDLKMIRIPAGSVGSVAVDVPFWLSDREISVALFKRFMTEANPNQRPDNWEGVYTFGDRIDDDHPVQSVSWEEAILFCNWLSLQHGLTECYEFERLEQADENRKFNVRLRPETDGFRLPTEREWEYACRATTTTSFACGEDTYLPAYSLFRASKTERCGSKLCNAWGLFDMHGNVYEFCWDARGSLRVFRGGSWGYTARNCGSSLRFGLAPSNRQIDVGFRVAAAPSGTLRSSFLYSDTVQGDVRSARN